MQATEQSSDLRLFLGTDQPETCRNCGARTEFEEVSSQQQIHECSGCRTQYLLEFEDWVAP